MVQELQVINDCYELARYLGERIEKFPRPLRHGLGAGIEQRLQEVLALLIRAKYTGSSGPKGSLLADVNIEIEILRFQLRLAQDRKALPTSSHRQAVAMLEQVGVQVGGWRRSLRPAPSTSS